MERLARRGSSGSSAWTAGRPPRPRRCLLRVERYLPGTGTSNNQGILEATTNGAQSWVAEQAPDGTETKRISCATTSDCWITALADGVFATSDGGATWTQQDGAVGFEAPEAIACSDRDSHRSKTT